MSKSYFDLMDLIEQQSEVIKNQSNIITRLLNDNVEKENMIQQLSRECL